MTQQTLAVGRNTNFRLRPGSTVELSGYGQAEFRLAGGQGHAYQLSGSTATAGPFAEDATAYLVGGIGNLLWELREVAPGGGLTSTELAALQTGRQIKMALLGDSLMAQFQTTGALSADPTYSSATGVATFAQTAHGHYSGMLCRVSNTAGGIWNGLSLTRVDANSFRVVLPAGLTLPTGETWYLGQESGLNCAGPFTFLRPARPIVYNYGCAGALTAEVLLNLPQVLASDANVVWLRAGANDVAGGGVAGVAAVLADIVTMADAIVDSGRTLILSTTPPLGTTTAGGATTSNMRAGVIALSRRLKNTYLIDEHAIGVDPASATGSARTGYQASDNTHFSALYSKLVAAKLQTILDAIGSTGVSPCPTSALDAYHATDNTLSTQVFPTPTLITATGGTAGTGTTGTVAANLTTFGTGAATPVASVVAAANGIGNAQQLVGTPAANNDLMRVTTSASGSAVAALVVAGQRRKWVAHLKVTGLTGNPCLQSYAFLIVVTTAEGTFSGRISDQNWSGTAARITQGDFETDLESGEFVVPVGCTVLYCDIQLKFAASGTAVTMQASQFGCLLVA